MDKAVFTLHWLNEMQAIAQTGLSYSKDPYDKERYQRLLQMSLDGLSKLINVPYQTLANIASHEIGYATPKLCVRAIIYQANKLLLVKERSDGLWSLPGGWADVNFSLSENIVKEVSEETGFHCKPLSLLALLDKQKQENPPHWPHTYIAFFHCKLISGEFIATHEIEAADFFSIDQLPPLCPHRNPQRQILNLVKKIEQGFEPDTLFD